MTEEKPSAKNLDTFSERDDCSLENKYRTFGGWEEDIPESDSKLFKALHPQAPSNLLVLFRDVAKQISEINLNDIVILYSYIHNLEPANFRRLNEQLREGRITPETDQVVKELNAALEKLPTYQGITFRGIQAEDLRYKMLEQMRSQYQVGATIQERAFISASKYPQGSRGGFVRFTIHSTKGRDLRDIQPIEMGEVVFKSGTNFNVLNFALEGDSNKPDFIDIEMAEVG
jgi:hypothetical protein